ncbi:winged helix DNA-binding domain-containing protein [Dactylosporangium vinaceum]|uniref:Winged helix DNA-binding domain-containing protein n=1 Tax=Dactylosporangium vinaceum TaxID=53362 RepID=A0ABV5MCK0_9ACTN|nr:winged helix DNA-binding domain-containing protein [Dactylosporangium vinaceum]
MTISVTWDDVLHWRCRQQWLHRPAEAADPVAVVTRLGGVQAQVASAAEQAVAARQETPDPGSVGAALAERRLVKTWTVRGTLHLLPPEPARAQLALLGAARTWETGSWQRTFVTAAQMEKVTAAAAEVLDGRELTREELTAAIVEHAGDPALGEHLRSGWGTVLKPVAWQGLLVYGTTGVTFSKPAWDGLPQPAAAARSVIPAYLGAYGPASAATFDRWLIRGRSKPAALRAWFAELLADGVIAEVDVEGERLYARSEDLETLQTPKPFEGVRLLPAFDQFVLGPGTADTRIIPPEQRARVSRAAGWISPVVVHRGRVAGVWDDDGETLWAKVPAAGIRAERARRP